MNNTIAFDPRRLLPVGRHGWLIRTSVFTPTEVRQLLSVAPTTPRGWAVARCAARVSAWLPPEPHFIHCPQHTWQHLARIVFWYTRGDAIETIGQRLGTLGASWSTERALDVACARMADCLNQDGTSYGLPRRSWRDDQSQPWSRR